MSAQFEWKEEFSIGVDAIDRDHQQLFRIINKLFSFWEEGKNSQWACQEGIKFFKSHALEHFLREEAYMDSVGYPGTEAHRRIHASFRDNTLPVLERELEKTDYAHEAVEHFLGVCAGWLIGHTLTEDMAIAGRSSQKWDGLLSGEDTESMKKVILQLLFDMFQLESHVISDAYGGEKFGKGVYYHLVYRTGEEKKKQEVALVFEDKLLINTVGKVMGIQTNKLDDMITHASRYTARQFVKRFMECFPEMESYELEEENLLFYDQFQQFFQREQMQLSLLMDTGAGYFACCMVAPHLLEKGVGTPIREETAAAEVDEYLARRRQEEKAEKARHRPKILVVDDSATIRQGMELLLKESYQVALAGSGIAAIRSITLDQPDLVLLDYEMPVCDGRQTLEMLRSDPAFADIPVIFLTGKRDPESMIKVMPLKPAGYLIKSAKQENIKKEIDAFFAKKETS